MILKVSPPQLDPFQGFIRTSAVVWGEELEKTNAVLRDYDSLSEATRYQRWQYWTVVCNHQPTTAVTLY